MTPKEKAIELVDKFYDKIEDIPIECGMYCLGGTIDKKLLSKQCASIAVKELKNNLCPYCIPDATYYEQVETEIENL